MRSICRILLGGRRGLLGFESVPPEGGDVHATLGDADVKKRTWSFSAVPSTTIPGDLKIDPPLTVPVAQIKGNNVQVEIANLPFGKAAPAGAACVELSCYRHLHDYLDPILAPHGNGTSNSQP